jgi:plasmid maintenance system antidote protein VapI
MNCWFTLTEHDLALKGLAQKAGVSEAFLGDVVRGREPISERLAEGLERTLGRII